MFRPMRAPVVLAVAVVGCQNPRWDSPELAYASFAKLLQKGELKAAYDALSGPTREAIEARAREVADASGGAVRDDPAYMTFLTGVKPQPVTRLELVEHKGTEAIVRVTSGEKSAEVRLVKEGDRWKVDLTDAFKK